MHDDYMHHIAFFPCAWFHESRQNFRNPHPFGQIPCLKDGDIEIFESGAILLYLAQKYGGCSTVEAMAEVTKWVVWANSALDPILFLENERGTPHHSVCPCLPALSRARR